MIQLPLELYGEIVSYFEFSEGEGNIQFATSGHQFGREAHGRPDITTLRNLRLTSKLFGQAASQSLFKSILLQWPCKPVYTVPESTDTSASIGSFLTTPGHNLLPLIKNFEMSFTSPNEFVVQGRAGSLGEAKFELTRETLAKLPAVLSNLSGLEHLGFSIGWWTSDYDGGSEPGTAPQLDIQLLDKSINDLAIGLSNLSHLTSLQLVLPVTFYFEELVSKAPVALFAGVRHLMLAVTDATGPGGSKDYLWWADEDGDGDEGFPSSNLQQLRPNTKHAQGLFHFVKKHENLESLAIEGTQSLDADLLQWKPASSGLRSVHLSRVNISAENLIKLLSPCNTMGIENSVLLKVWLEEVDLTSGAWASVFQHLSACPRMSYFDLGDLSYTRDGESSNFKEYPSRAWEDFSHLWTRNLDDEVKITALMKILVKRAGGIDKYPNDNMWEVELSDEEDSDGQDELENGDE